MIPVGIHTVTDFTTVMATMTVNIFPTYIYCDQRLHLWKYLRMSLKMKVQVLTSMCMQLNMHLPYFLPDCVGQLVASFPDNENKEILYHTMRNLWKKNRDTHA